ncbi:efflux RND transporter permease subunit [Candidatus Ruthia endofausta]|uniref:Efflux RND transporter permease subunit n=1 Tax=Candidatus Ruthia endofausta TaxID=2738852 RepID=A0A6N0HMW8_9GAMM|nr:efflux RND transporter permease subunit [Candidatus Ruthia endofausta]QKQ23679.1 efflux RND transporter permease subunit [Candidatus Ruthia endofausta]
MTAERIKEVVDHNLQKIAKTLLINYWLEYDGVITNLITAQKALSSNLPMVLDLIIIFLVAQFNSYLKPLIIVLTIPLALIGAVIGLLVSSFFFRIKSIGNLS